ncbi:MAG: SURF1 family protein [Gammaproteobacteria bacterium]
MSNSATFSVFGKRYYFTPKFTLVTILLIAVLIGLGIWQLNQAKHVAEVFEAINKRLLLDPIQVNDLQKDNDWRFYPIQMRGTFDNEHEIFLSHRSFKGEQGYEVLTPFKPHDSDIQILVNRGWIPMESDPSKLPDIKPVKESVSLFGVLVKTAVYFSLGSDFDENNIHWPLLTKRINTAKLSALLSAPLFDYVVLLSPSSPYGYEREWIELTTTLNADNNKNYAMEWFALAIAVFLIFIFSNIERDRS